MKIPRLMGIAMQLAEEAGLDANDGQVMTALVMGMDVGLSLAFRSPEWAQAISQEAAEEYMKFAGKSLADKIAQMDNLIVHFPVSSHE